MHLTPYATGAAAKKGRGRGGNAAAGQEDYDLELKEDEAVAAEESEHSDNDDVTTDTMIKVGGDGICCNGIGCDGMLFCFQTVTGTFIVKVMTI